MGVRYVHKCLDSVLWNRLNMDLWVSTRGFGIEVRSVQKWLRMFIVEPTENRVMIREIEVSLCE